MPLDQQKISEEERKFYLKKTAWLYSGVFIFSAVIICFFTLAMKANFKNYSWQKTDESKIISSATDDINTYLEKEKENLKKQEVEEAKLEAQTKLNELVTNYENNKKQGVQEIPVSTTGTEAQISE